MQKLRPKSPNGGNCPSFYSSPPITTFNHTQISLLPVLKLQPASGKPRPRAGVIKLVSPNFCPKTCPSCHVIGLPQAHNQISDFVATGRWRMDDGRPACSICEKIKIA